MIHLLHQPATFQQVSEMLEEYDGMIKIVVDIRRRALSGGEMQLRLSREHFRGAQ
jgi:hypothetical protein